MMSANRFIESLEESLKSNPDQCAHWIEHCHNKIQTNDVSRCLDEFPNLVQSSEIKDQIEIFDNILFYIKHYDTQISSSYYVPRRIHDALSQLIEYACSSLFDKYGGIQKKLIKLLQLDQLVAGIENYRMITAVISFTIPVIHKSLAQQYPQAEIFREIIPQINILLQQELHQQIYQNKYQCCPASSSTYNTTYKAFCTK